MATMVAAGSSPLAASILIREMGSRNKRKFRGDVPSIDLNKLAASLQTECGGYDFFPDEKDPDNASLEYNAPDCDLCADPADGPREETVQFLEFHDSDWSGVSETQLEEILLSNLDMVFKSAIKSIASYGYAVEVAMNAVLGSGVCCGCKDTTSNIVENALVFLRSGQEVDSSLTENYSEDLEKLKKSVLTDMVNVIREVRPVFSTGDAMWCLLICDMNVAHACTMDDDSLTLSGNGDASSSSNPPRMESPPVSAIPEFNVPVVNKLNTILPYPQNTLQPGIPAAAGIPSLPSGRFAASSNRNDTISNLKPGKENSTSESESVAQSSVSTISQSCPVEEKRPGGRKGHAGISKRESILKQQSIHYEKCYKAFVPKAISRTGKISTLGSLVLDKKCKSGLISAGMTVKDTPLNLTKTAKVHTPQASTTVDLTISNGSPTSSSYGLETTGNSSALPLASTELSLSLPSTSSNAVRPKSNCSIGAATRINYLGIPSLEMCGHLVPRNKKDEMLLHLIPRLHDLQAQLQEWTEWAQQKVMQVARRLSKDKAELQSLRQEKEEVARLKKEKQNLEENTKKKLSEMEIALSKASGQVGKANAAARMLEVENDELRQEMEAAKVQAAASANACQEISSRETMTLKRFQSWERQKTMFHEEFMIEKHKKSQLQQQLKQATEVQNQVQARWKVEETMKEEALVQANTTGKEREQIEVSGKAMENAIRMKAETDLQKYKDDARRIGNQISQLRFKMGSSKVEALRWGAFGNYASCLSDGKKDSTAQLISKIMDSLELGVENLQRERECVMCLSEEISVVFLPCAHQAVCTKCNDHHEKQGMKDCPSCRTPIERRICVLAADS